MMTMLVMTITMMMLLLMLMMTMMTIEDLVQPWSCRQANDMAAARHT